MNLKNRDKTSTCMCHILKSIDFKTLLYDILPFPDLAIEIIIKYLGLAIDLNGYTNAELKLYIYKNTTRGIPLFLKTVYGKHRSTIDKLKKYQLIHVIQHFSIPIVIYPFKINYIAKYFNDNIINLKIDNNNITFESNNTKYELNKNKLIHLNRISLLIRNNNKIIYYNNNSYLLKFSLIIFIKCIILLYIYEKSQIIIEEHIIDEIYHLLYKKTVPYKYFKIYGIKYTLTDIEITQLQDTFTHEVLNPR